MQQFPMVSVIIPAYNEEKYIIKTLSAVLQQDYPNYEVIVVNNASTDATERLVNEFIQTLPATGPQIIFCTEEKQGTNYARECARKLATGKIIAQLDADCVPGKHWVSNGVKLLSGSAVAATGPYDYFDAPIYMRAFTFLSQYLTYPIVSTIVQVANRGGILIGGNAFVKAKVLELAGGYNTAFTFYGDDVDIAAKVSSLGWIRFSSTLLLPSSSRRYKAIGFWKVIKKYQDCFWNVVFRKDTNPFDTLEMNHPR